MTYKAYIHDKDTGNPIAGAIYFYDLDNQEVGQAVIGITGSSFDVAGPKFIVTAPGHESYGYLNADQLYDETVFTLSRKPTTWLPFIAGGLAAVLYYKLFYK